MSKENKIRKVGYYVVLLNGVSTDLSEEFVSKLVAKRIGDCRRIEKEYEYDCYSIIVLFYNSN